MVSTHVAPTLLNGPLALTGVLCGVLYITDGRVAPAVVVMTLQLERTPGEDEKKNTTHTTTRFTLNEAFTCFNKGYEEQLVNNKLH